MRKFHSPIRLIQNANVFTLFVLGLMGFAVLAHHRSVAEGGFIFDWSHKYFFFVLVPLLFFWAAHILFLSQERLRNLFCFKNKLYRWCFGAFGLCLILVSIMVKVNIYQARILFFIFCVLAMFLSLSFWFDVKELVITYFCFAFLGCLLFTFELPQLLETRHNKFPIVWGDSEAFKFLFEKKPPFIGLGGRLRPSVRCRIWSPGTDDLGVRFTTNQWGFRNEEIFPENPSKNEIRILNMGDSFSNGFGIDQDQFLGPLLEKQLQKTFADRKILVMNAEVSDPAYGLYYFQNYGNLFSPKVVLYGLCGNDVFQSYWFISYTNVFAFSHDKLMPGEGSKNNVPVFGKAKPDFWNKVNDIAYPVSRTSLPHHSQEIRNPFQHFIEDLLKFRAMIYLRRLFFPFKAEDESLLFATSKIPEVAMMEHADGRKRLIDWYPNLAFFYKKRIPLVEEMYGVFFKILQVMALRAKQNGQLFVLIYFPERIQVREKDWELFRNRWNLNPEDFNLDLHNQRIANYCQIHRINFLDLTDSFRDAARERNLYLPNNEHPNHFGHAVAAQALAEFLTQKMKSTFLKS